MTERREKRRTRDTVRREEQKEEREPGEPDFQAGPCDIKYFRRPLSLASLAPFSLSHERRLPRALVSLLRPGAFAPEGTKRKFYNPNISLGRASARGNEKRSRARMAGKRKHFDDDDDDDDAWSVGKERKSVRRKGSRATTSVENPFYGVSPLPLPLSDERGVLGVRKQKSPPLRLFPSVDVVI